MSRLAAEYARRARVAAGRVATAVAVPTAPGERFRLLSRLQGPPSMLRLRVFARSARLRIGRLAAALARARVENAKLAAKLAAANRQIQQLIDSELALDDARHKLVLQMGGQVVDLQEALDGNDADLDRAAQIVDDQDQHIAKLQLALLTRPSTPQ